MPSLFLLTPGSRASLHGERLVLDVPPPADASRGETLEIPLRDVEQVVLTETVHLSMPALAECMRRNIPIILTSRGERVLGLCLPPAPHSAARLAQYRMADDMAFALRCAAAWVEAKILNSRRVLQRLAANRTDPGIENVLSELAALAGKCQQAESMETLRGYEGTAAGRYFEAYGRFFPDDCPFERRSRRPPHNAPNAILSYAYTLLCAEMECRVYALGLDPCVGFFHEAQDRRPSLALDLIEPFRAPVADALALDLLSHGTLKADRHFESRDGGVYLNTEGKKRFFVAYERRMTRLFYNERHQRRTTLRDELHHQALALKNSVTSGRAPEVFLMN